jgi:hypothetical protein
MLGSATSRTPVRGRVVDSAGDVGDGMGCKPQRMRKDCMTDIQRRPTRSRSHAIKFSLVLIFKDDTWAETAAGMRGGNMDDAKCAEGTSDQTGKAPLLPAFNRA